MSVKDIINQFNKVIEEKSLHQGNWHDEFIYDFEDYIDYPDELKATQMWESKVDEHRWFGLQEIVFELSLGEDIEYVKVNLVTQSYSEMQSLGDIYHTYSPLKIVYPKEVKTIVYE